MDTRSYTRMFSAAGFFLALLLIGRPAFSAGYYLEEFDDGQANNWTLTTGWAVAGAASTGLYLSGVNNSARSYAIYENNTWDTGYAYTVRMNSPTWPTSSQIGSVFNYLDGSNFYEVLFSQTTMSLYKTVGGVRTLITSKPYTGALRSNRYTDIQVLRLGSNVTIRFNGTEMLTQALTPAEVFEGRVGLVTDHNTSQFDYAVVTTATTPVTPDFPRLATVRIGTWDWDTTAVRAELARMHYVIVPYSTTWPQSPHRDIDLAITDVKNASTVGTKVIVYTKANEANFLNQSEKTEQTVWDKIDAMNWWVRDSQSPPQPVSAMYKPAIFKLVNLTRNAPADPVTGLKWSRWFAKWTVDNYYTPNTSIDGFYMDNVNWKPPASATPTEPGHEAEIADWDRDGISDPGTRADVHQWFRRGFRDYFDEISVRLPSSKFKFANLSTWGQTTPADNAELAEYYGAAHGGVIESLIAQNDPASPEQWSGWSRAMETYRKTMSALAGQKVAMFMNGLVDQLAGNPAAYYRDMRYGLGSCLLDDGYYTPYVQGHGYTLTPIFDEFNVNLGQATSPPPIQALPSGVWRRDFQNGIVLVNPKGNGAQNNIALGGTFHHISGTQDPTVNNGQTVTTISLADRDGIILLR